MKNKNPKLSIIIPVYNTEKYLIRCLDSIIHQTYKNLEIIVVNDCSQGPCDKILDKYVKKHKNIKCIKHNTNKGLFQARVTGLESASGDYFTFVDSDDYISIDLYRVMIKKAQECDADIVATDRLEVLEDKNCYYSPNDLLQQVDWDLSNTECLDLLMQQNGLDYGLWVIWNKIYSIDLWKKAELFIKQYSKNILMCEDVAFSVTFFSYATKFVNVHHNYYYYLRNSKSSTISKDIDFSKYEKNINDVIYAFFIAQNALKNIKKWDEYSDNWQKWFNQLLSTWKDRVNNSKLNYIDKNTLLNIIAEHYVDLHTNPVDLDRNFCGHGTEWHSADLYNNIKTAICDKNIKVVSFDIFDTLIVRPFWHPTDVFHLLDEYINDIVRFTDYFVFTDIRIEAEYRARERKRADNPQWEEVSLDEIYYEVGIICPKLKIYCEAIKNKEKSIELNYCLTRNSGKELYECAIAAGKKVIITSDMYLPKETIVSILHKNGYTNYKGLYLSSEIGLTKSSGNLYSYLIEKEGVRETEILHIGDNWISDVENARSKKILASHLPKTTEVFSNANNAIYAGKFYYNIFHAQKGFLASHDATNMWGFRCLLAVAANRIFDNPFVFYDKLSDFNADAYTIGYICLGMFSLASANWLISNASENKYDNICFMARDGYLTMKAYEILNSVYNIKSECHYLFLSRKAILPLMFYSEEDMYSLYNNFGLSTSSPEDIVKILKPIIKDDIDVKKIFQQNKIPFSGPFGTIKGYMNFVNIFFEYLYSQEKSNAYKTHMKNYFDSFFEGKSATFDVGYNARCESILKNNFGYDITAHYIHINNDRPFGRIEKSGIKLKTLYPHSPFITGIMREQLMSELIPSCIGYKDTEKGFVPVFETGWRVNFQTKFVTLTIQKAALDYVKDVISIFKDDYKRLPFRIYDACMPIEYYLHYATNADKDIFKGTLFEDDMGMGNNKSLVDFWNHELHRWAHEDRTVVYNGVGSVNYDAYPFVKRWLLILGGNWGEGKKRISQKLSRCPLFLGCLRELYHVTRWTYRKLK